MNIILIGMPGAGKSTVGVILAKTMKMSFADTDILIQDREKQTLQEIINNRGLDEFLEIEEKVVSELELRNTVIATGGSVVLKEAAMKHLKEIGIIIYLRLPYTEIERRIENITTRGIAMGNGQSLNDIYLQRSPLYDRYAQIVIDCNEKETEDIVREVKQMVEKN